MNHTHHSGDDQSPLDDKQRARLPQDLDFDALSQLLRLLGPMHRKHLLDFLEADRLPPRKPSAEEIPGEQTGRAWTAPQPMMETPELERLLEMVYEPRRMRLGGRESVVFPLAWPSRADVARPFVLLIGPSIGEAERCTALVLRRADNIGGDLVAIREGNDTVSRLTVAVDALMRHRRTHPDEQGARLLLQDDANVPLLSARIRKVLSALITALGNAGTATIPSVGVGRVQEVWLLGMHSS